MFGTLALTVLFTSLLARADVTPSVPGPGVVYTVGGVCHIEWDGDHDSNTVWKDMSIELMSGSNFDMIHLTTVATGQDGTASGFFDHTCPDVTPYSDIYFYQFTSPTAADKTWTTRFTIAGKDGSSVAPQNPTQPGTGEKIPWGSGALKDASTAIPAPTYLSSTGTSTSTNTTVQPTSSTALLATATSSSITTTSTKASTVSTSSPATTTANSTTTNNQQNNDAMGSIVVDNTVWGAALTLAVSAIGFSMLL